MLGISYSVDEMTMRFKGSHKEKRRITHKREGNGLQCNTLCQDSFCYHFYFCNNTAPSKYLKQGMYPLHARVMSLFDSTKEKFHVCGMYNLHNSDLFCNRSFSNEKNVMVHGVTRKVIRGILPIVKKGEVKNRKKLEFRGTVKAAVLRVDKGCPKLVSSSVYDTKPIHFLSMVCQKLKWIDNGNIRSLTQSVTKYVVTKLMSTYGI